MHVIGVEHSMSTLLWPQRNSEVEAFMKPLCKALTTVQAEQHSWSQELSRFLLSYRTTPHFSTKVPPAQLLFNRQVRGKLPVLNTKSNVINRHREARQMMQSRNNSPNSMQTQDAIQSLQEDDTVLMQQRKQNKLSPRFSTHLTL